MKQKEEVQQAEINLVLHLPGGLGKAIMATAVIRSYKKANPNSKIVVVSGYPEVFINNPDIYRNLPFNTPYLWQDFYGKPGWIVEAQDPYLTDAWIKNRKQHLIDIWCGMLKVPNVQKTPLLYFSDPELDEINSMIKVDKPLLVVQSTGGGNPASRSWTRNPPHYEFNNYLSKFAESHFIVHLAVPETPALENIHQRIEGLTRRQAMVLVHYSPAFVGIDSFGLHARSANPNAGDTTIFFPLAESVDRLGYKKVGWNNLTPVQEVQDMLKDHQDYYATVFKFNIENAGENCPVIEGTKWFNLGPEKA